MLKPKQTTWNLKLLFKSDNDPMIDKKRKAVESESYKFINKWKGRTDYLEDPAIMKQALNEYENWQRYYGTDGDEGVYFYLRTCQDQNNSKLKAKLNKIQNASIKISNDIQFFTMKIARIPEEKQKIFLESPELKEYKHFLEKLFREAKYLLSEPEEKILNLKSIPAYTNWVNMTEGFLAREERSVLDSDGRKKIKSFSEILSLATDKNKKVRNTAAKAVNDIFEKNADVAEAEMNSIIADKKINDELRGFPRPDSAMHLSDDIDSEIADILISAAAERFDISKRYYCLKAKLFGVKKLEYHEKNVEYGKNGKKYSYQESVNLVYEVFSKVDGEFAKIFKDFVDNGHMDVYPKKGKSGGAFCLRHLISQPTFILLNHTGKLHDVFTIAHESGHGINSELVKKNQNSLNAGGPYFSSEIASKLSEEFAFEGLLAEKSDERRLEAMMMKLDDEIQHIFSTAARNRFEREMHKFFREKGYISKGEIGELYKKHNIEFTGDAVRQTPGSENWWMHVTHLRVFFYNYQYAAGILIAKALYDCYKKYPAFKKNIKEFLSAGTSASPKEIFEKFGMDITDKKFWQAGISDIERLLAEAEKLAKKMGKI